MLQKLLMEAGFVAQWIKQLLAMPASHIRVPVQVTVTLADIALC